MSLKNLKPRPNISQEKILTPVVSTHVGVDMQEIVADFASQLQPYANGVDSALIAAQKFTIDSQEEMLQAQDQVVAMRKLGKKIDAARLEILEPTKTFTNKVNTLAKSFTTKLEQAIDILTQKVSDHIRKEEAAKAKAIEADAILDELTGVKAESAVVVAPVSETSSTYTTTEWVIVVEDIYKVPARFLLLNEQAAKSAAKAGFTDIPGLKITQQQVTRIRTK